MKDIHSPLLGELSKLGYKLLVALSSQMFNPCLLTYDCKCLFCIGNIGLIWTTSGVPLDGIFVSTLVFPFPLLFVGILVHIHNALSTTCTDEVISVSQFFFFFFLFLNKKLYV